MKTPALPLLSLCLVAFGFVLASTAAPSQETTSEADTAQAEVDPHGMRTWYLALLKRGPRYHEVQGDERKEVFAGHFGNMEALAEEGYLRLAGPFGVPPNAPKDAWAGLFLLDVKEAEEAHDLCRTDPSIEADVFDYELLEWWGPSDITFRGDPRPPAENEPEAR